MSPRVRIYGIVAACAVAAAGLTVGLTLATRTTPPKATQARAGRPPLELDLGVRTDREAVDLRRAANLYNAGKVAQAARIFARYSSVEAQVGAALAAWPGGFSKLRTLADEHSHESVVQLNYGLGLFWRGDDAGAEAAWSAARRAQPDTPYAVHAEDLLHPNFPRGLPTFVPSFDPPAELAKLSPPQQLAFLQRDARGKDEHARLLYGVALQRLGRPVSALRAFESAAALAPRDPEAQVAVAVGRFDKADPSRTFSLLGPLAKRYPASQSVRFHLGLCLLWLASVKQAEQELRLASAAGPRTPLGVEAAAFLAKLKRIGH